VSYDRNLVQLKWTSPRDDGGSPVTGYIVEKYEKRGGGDWSQVNSVPVVGTEYTVPGLAENETYQFRIKAVNLAGESLPSRSSDLVTCRPFVSKWRKPY